MSFPSLILASTLSDRSGSKDNARKENELLCSELDNLQREQKKLKQIVEQLARDYEESKGYDPIRRYERLKGMIKRTIMHLRLNPDEPGSAQGPGIGGLVQGCKDYSYQVESAKRREEKYSGKYILNCNQYLDVLTHCILADSPNITCRTSPSVILGVSGQFCCFYSIFDGKNSVSKPCSP